MTKKIAGIDPGQRQLNGPQTTGRDFRNLSQPEHGEQLISSVRFARRDAEGCATRRRTL
jgi:hypothetical protein